MTRQVLIAVDIQDPDCWPTLLPEVRDLARSENTLHLMHIVPEQEALSPLAQFIPEGFENAHRAESRASLEALSGELPKAGELQFHRPR
ncbi:hypothetical protein ACOTTU_18875 [Roseobacter sp. EG26]|uniref:hypothetical protein n=1 Tax=Roseobacter sp. EG26 TaxID=3412477 RepID=UPI003CE4EABB